MRCASLAINNLVPRGLGLPGGDDGTERDCRFPEMPGPTPIFG
jgi:hypothetical protein